VSRKEAPRKIWGPSFVRVMPAVTALTGVVLWTYARIAWNLPWGRVGRYLTAEGNFPQSVAIAGITGYAAYKFFERKNNSSAAAGALAAMILWFLILLILKFGR